MDRHPPHPPREQEIILLVQMIEDFLVLYLGAPSAAMLLDVVVVVSLGRSTL